MYLGGNDPTNVDDDHSRRVIRHLLFQRFQADGKGVRIGIQEPHPPSGVQHRRWRSKEGVGWNQYLLALYGEHSEADFQGGGAAINCNSIANSMSQSESLLKLLCVLAESKLSCY